MMDLEKVTIRTGSTPGPPPFQKKHAQPKTQQKFQKLGPRVTFVLSPQIACFDPAFANKGPAGGRFGGSWSIQGATI